MHLRTLNFSHAHSYNTPSIEEFTTKEPTPNFELPTSFCDAVSCSPVSAAHCPRVVVLTHVIALPYSALQLIHVGVGDVSINSYPILVFCTRFTNSRLPSLALHRTRPPVSKSSGARR